MQPLKYAKRDAELIQTFLMQEAGFNRIFLFTDDSPPIGGKPTEPFRANLLRVLRQIFEKPFMKDGDNFWFFFSGHGIPHNGQDYLMPLDGDPEDIETTGISTNTITNYLRSCGADNAVMILDACRSGGKKSGEGIGKQTEAEARQTGVISLFSCSPEQYSYELEAIGQGAFTYALLEGLGIRGKCATVERLNQYLEHRVPELVSQHLSRVRQVPYMIAEPLNRSHLILMPQHAHPADIAPLKNDAYRAQMNQNWNLAQQLWIRVNAAASGQDMDAIEALQNLGIQRHTRTVPPQPEPPQTSASSKASLQPTVQPPKATSEQSTPTTLISSTSTARPSPVPASPPPSHNRSNQPPVSSPLTRRQVLKWAILAGVIAVVTVASQFLGHQSPQSSPSSTSDTSSNPSSLQPPASTATLSPVSPVNYSKLEEFLKAGKWKDADQETTDLMLKTANRESESSLDSASIKAFPCNVLKKIDNLWLNASNRRFGFSVQKKIYVETCGGKPDGQYDKKAWSCFGDQVGWRVNNKWTDSSKLTDVTFNIQALKGHLPRQGGFRGYGFNGLDVVGEWSEGEGWIQLLFHAETCKL